MNIRKGQKFIEKGGLDGSNSMIHKRNGKMFNLI